MRPPALRLPVWIALILVAASPVALPGAADPTPEPVAIEVHADQRLGPWEASRFTGIAYAGAYGTTTAAESEHAFRWIRATGAVAYVRCVTWLADGIAADDPLRMAGAAVLRRGTDGRERIVWDRLTRALDTIVASGARPVIVLSDAPDALVDVPVRYQIFGAPLALPDPARYGALVGELVRHLIRTYGADEVRRWYFEVGHAPDHAAFSAGGRRPPFAEPIAPARVAPFLALWEAVATSLRVVDPRLRVGGPGIWGDRSFLRAFLAHVATRGNTPAHLDFVSWQARGTSEAIVASVREVRELLRREFPTLADVEPILSAWSGPEDEPPEVAFGPREATRLLALVEAFVSEPARAGPPPRLFRWGTLVADHFTRERPLFVRLGTNTAPLPIFRAMQWLRLLTGDRIAATAAGDVHVLAARTRRGDVRAILYRPGDTASPGTRPIQVTVRGVDRRAAVRAFLYQIDPERANLHAAWVAAGRPRPAPDSLAEEHAAQTELPPVWERFDPAATGGVVTYHLDLPVDGMALLCVGDPPRDPPFSPRGRARRVYQAEQAFARAASAHLAGDVESAIVRYRALIAGYPDTLWADVALAAMARAYEEDLRSPAEADAAWQALLARPIDDVQRLEVLRQRLLLAARRQDGATADALRAEIDALEAELRAKRNWAPGPEALPR